LRPQPSKQIGGVRSGDESSKEDKEKVDPEEEGKVFSAEGGDIGYDSFLRPMKMMRNQSHNNNGRGDSNSQENL
jgi:hypothetical protein